MEYYYECGRDGLPWRKNPTTYYVTVSEIMLQQTQVDRVVPFFKKWMKQFPTWRVLGKAPWPEVLGTWKGLGYNSRALRLQKLAQEVTEIHNGQLPSNYKLLIKLPGIGPYTAGAILAFAFNSYIPLIETNIRRVFIHHFFKEDGQVSDSEIFEIMSDIGEIEDARKWYSALMDYGSTLPKIIKHNPNIQSKHYTKQSKFKDSNRQIRGKILEVLLQQKNHKISKQKLFTTLYDYKERGNPKDKRKLYQKICDKLVRENFIRQTKKSLILR